MCIYDVQRIIVTDVFLQPKASRCHTLGLTSDNFPPVSDGQNKLAYNVWYVSVNRAVADVTQGTPQPSRVCSTFSYIRPKPNFFIIETLPSLALEKKRRLLLCCFVANNKLK